LAGDASGIDWIVASPPTAAAASASLSARVAAIALRSVGAASVWRLGFEQLGLLASSAPKMAQQAPKESPKFRRCSRRSAGGARDLVPAALLGLIQRGIGPSEAAARRGRSGRQLGEPEADRRPREVRRARAACSIAAPQLLGALAGAARADLGSSQRNSSAADAAATVSSPRDLLPGDLGDTPEAPRRRSGWVPKAVV
jgi:hypothetical protein